MTAAEVQAFKLLRRFTRYMKLRDVIYLVAKLFLGKKAGATKAEVPASRELRTASASGS